MLACVHSTHAKRARHGREREENMVIERHEDLRRGIERVYKKCVLRESELNHGELLKPYWESTARAE